MKWDKWINGAGYPPSRIKDSIYYVNLGSRLIRNMRNKAREIFKLKYIPKKLIRSYFRWNYHEKRFFMSLILRNNKFYTSKKYFKLLKNKIFAEEKNRNMKKIFFMIKIRLSNKITRQKIKTYLRNYTRLGSVLHLYYSVPKSRIKYIRRFIREQK
jgi:hypothetical protein